MNSLFETIIIGLNCGHDEVFPGGYDWFPCQHERYQQTGDGNWINKISYCAGSDDKCLSKGNPSKDFSKSEFGTIHLRRRQIFTIFDPSPPTVGIPAKCL